jgi:hypothetical protein
LLSHSQSIYTTGCESLEKVSPVIWGEIQTEMVRHKLPHVQWTARQDIEGRMECWSGSGKANVRYESESVLEELLPWTSRELCTPIYSNITKAPAKVCLFLYASS